MSNMSDILDNYSEKASMEHICPVEEDSDSFYDDDDCSVSSYDSIKLLDRISSFQNTAKCTRHWDDDEEEEFSEDETTGEEDKEQDYETYLRSLNEKYADQLNGLSAISDKLNWLQKVSPPLKTMDVENFPELLTNLIKPVNREKQSPIKFGPFRPADHIEVKIGEKTFIVTRKEAEPKTICKFMAMGKVCAYGDKCKFSHVLDTKKKWCKTVKNGEICPFGDKCKFLHLETENLKPNCKYSKNCNNPRCTFIHPEGRTIKPAVPKPLTVSDTSLTQRIKEHVLNETLNSAKSGQSKKLWLCKNMFKVTSQGIEELNSCKFGNACIYAHNKEEISQNVEVCRFGEKCNAVVINFINKGDGKVRRYENKEDAVRKCIRLHPKERLIDFIKRVQ